MRISFTFCVCISLCRYYAFDDAFVREVLGKKLSKGTKKDLDDISAKTNVTLKSCRRQVMSSSGDSLLHLNIHILYLYCNQSVLLKRLALSGLHCINKVLDEMNEWMSCERAFAAECLQSNYFCSFFRFYTSHVPCILIAVWQLQACFQSCGRAEGTPGGEHTSAFSTFWQACKVIIEKSKPCCLRFIFQSTDNVVFFMMNHYMVL